MNYVELLPILAVAAVAISPPLSTSCDGGDVGSERVTVGAAVPSISSDGEEPAASSLPEQLRVLSYNVFMRPIPLGWGDGSSCRAQEIGEKLADRAASLDVVVLNEAFESQAVDRLADSLGDALPYRALQLPNREFLSTNGGLSILSRHPIRELYTETFDSCSSWGDCFAEKGFLHAVVEVSSSIRVNVLATHLDAGDGSESPATRAGQLGTIREYLDSHEVGGDWPTLLVGDLNINGIRGLVDYLGPEQPERSEYQRLLSTLAGSCSDCTGMQCTDQRCDDRPVDALHAEAGPWAFTREQSDVLHTMNCREDSIEPCRGYDRPGNWRDRKRLDYILKLRTGDSSLARAELTDADHLAFRDDSCGTTYLSDHKAVRANFDIRPASVARRRVQ